MDYVEGQGPENVTFTSGFTGPIIWEVDFDSPTGFKEPRDMGWIPKLQQHVDELALEKLKEQNSDFAEWEDELGA